MFTLATLLQILIGLLTPVLLARFIHRRAGVPYALLVPGAIVGLALQLVGTLLQGGLIVGLASGPDLLTTPVFSGPVLPGLLGGIAGLLAAGLITAALVWLAPGARTLPQIAMLGVGVGSAEVLLRAALAALVLVANLDLSLQPPESWELSPAETAARQADLDAYFATPPYVPLLDAVIAPGTVAAGVAVTVLVGAMFLTGEVGWFFAGLLWSALSTTGALIFAQGGPQSSAVWWALAGGVSLAIIVRRWRQTRPPQN